MFSIFKKIFSKTPENQATAPVSAPPAPVPTPAAQAPSGPGPNDIAVSLKTVVSMLPDLLKKKLDRDLTGSETIWISKAEAMKQLPTGAVKIRFSEVVRMAPRTFLSPDAEMLATMVNLPLQEILPKIKTLPRRAEQRVVEVPEDLQPVFGAGAGDASRAVQPTVAPTAAVPPANAAPSTAAAPASLNIPAPTPRPVPAPVPATKTAQTPAPPVNDKSLPAQQPARREEAYTPPAPKPLPPQTPISLKPPTPAPIPVPQPSPSPTLAPISPISPAPPPAASESPEIPLGAIFGQPDKTDWTPQEVVEKASALRGVAGALITTTDGLPVAFHLPTDLSGNMVAAFVPQLYMRVVQYTRDLRLGDAKHITILVENTPLQIFKSGGVYFTALGRANESLPKPQLTAIALALGRQSPG